MLRLIRAKKQVNGNSRMQHNSMLTKQLLPLVAAKIIVITKLTNTQNVFSKDLSSKL